MNRFLRSIFVLFATIVVTFSPGKIKTVVDFYYQGDNFIVCAQAWKELGADWSVEIEDESIVKLTDNYYEESGNNNQICRIGGTRTFVFNYVSDGVTKVSMDLTKGGSYYFILVSSNDEISVYYSGEREPSESEVDEARPAQLISISAESKMPYFVEGEILSVFDFKITATYSDGSTKTVVGTQIDTPFEEYSTPGTHIITISYSENGVIKTADVKVEVKAAKDIERSNVRTKEKSYVQGYDFSVADVSASACLYDGTLIYPEIVSINTDSVDFDVPGIYTAQVVLAYEGKEYTTSFSITIINSPDGIKQVKCTPSKSLFSIGETLTADDISVTALCNDGSRKEIKEFDFTDVTFSSGGKQTLSLSFEDAGKMFTGTFDVTVIGTISVAFGLKSGVQNNFNDFDGIKASDFSATVRTQYDEKRMNTENFTPEIEEEFEFTQSGTFPIKLKYTDQWGCVFRGTVDINVMVERTDLENFLYDEITIANTGEQCYRILNVNPDYDGETLILPPETIRGKRISYFGSLSNLSSTEVKELIIPSGCQFTGIYPVASLERIVVETPYETGWKYASNAAKLGIEICFEDSFIDEDTGLIYAPFQNGYYVVEYIGSAETVTIPSTVNGKAVIGIGSSAFRETFVTAVEIPDSVTYIGRYAFYKCSIESFDFKNVADIDMDAFYGCNIDNLDLKNVTDVGASAFEGCPITSIKADKLENIEYHAFSGSKFTEAYFPMAKSVRGSAFSSTLRTVRFDSLEKVCDSFGHLGTIYITNKNEGELDLKISEKDIACSKVVVYWKDTKAGFNYDILDDGTIAVYRYICNPDETMPETLAIPETIDGYTVTRIGKGSVPVGFKGVETLELPDTVTSIAPRAFNNGDYSNGVIHSVKYIKGGSISEIGERAFERNGIYSVDTADEFSVGDYAFYQAANITFPDTITLTGLGMSAFSTKVNDYSNHICSNVIIKEGVTEIPSCCFDYAGIDSITLPSTLKSIGSRSLSANNFKEIVLPEELESIGLGAFMLCKNLESVYIPKKIDYISEACFAGCSKLKTVTSDSTITSVRREGFSGCSSLSDFDISVLTEIGMEAFNKCSSLTGELVINEAITVVEPYAFASCNFTSLKLHDGITVIAASAFERNYNMTGILTLPKNLWYLGDKAFDHDYSFKNETLTIPATCEYIGGDYPSYVGFYRAAKFDLKNRKYDNTTHMMYNFAPSTFREYIVEEGNPNYKSVDGVLFTKDGTHLVGFPCAKTLPEGRYEIPEGVTVIDDMCFSRAGYSGGNLKTVVLPDSYIVKPGTGYNSLSGHSIYWNSLSGALYSYSGIEAYEVKDTNPNYVSIDGVLYTKDMKTLVCVPQNYRGELIIPEGVETIAKGAFAMDSTNDYYPKHPYLTKLSIPSTVVNLNNNRYNAEFFNNLITRYGTEIEIAEGNEHLTMVDGKVQDKPKA